MSEKPTILVVEDDLPTRRLEAMILEKAGYIVIESDDAKTALDRLETDQVDIIISDIMMPGMDGIELLSILKTDPTTDKLPVILVSSVSEQDKVKQALRFGIAGYVLKPIVGPALLQRVQQASKQVPPVLDNPERTISRLGLGISQFQGLIKIMVEDAQSRLKEIDKDVESGKFEAFAKFSKDLHQIATNFGAEALKQSIIKACSNLPRASKDIRKKHIFDLQQELQRLQDKSKSSWFRSFFGKGH